MTVCAVSPARKQLCAERCRRQSPVHVCFVATCARGPYRRHLDYDTIPSLVCGDAVLIWHCVQIKRFSDAGSKALESTTCMNAVVLRTLLKFLNVDNFEYMYV